MSHSPTKPCSAFEGQRLLATGPLSDVALAVKTEAEKEPSEAILVFDDATGGVVDLDLRGTSADILARLREPERDDDPGSKGRGRPKLGVVSREITLLPRQWEWLATQPGGASGTIRRLVDEARRNEGPRQARREAQEAAYRFMQAIAGDLPGYEEAIRALFADDRAGMENRIAGWPQDVRSHALRLAFRPAVAISPADVTPAALTQGS